MLPCLFSSYSHRTPVYFTSCRRQEALDRGRQREAYRGTHLEHQEEGRGSFQLQAEGRADLQGAGKAGHQDRTSEVVHQAYQQERQAYQGKASEAFRELLELPGEGYRPVRLEHQKLREGAPVRHPYLGTEVACRQGKAGRGGRRRLEAGIDRDQEEFRRVGSEEAWGWRGLGLRRRTRR